MAQLDDSYYDATPELEVSQPLSEVTRRDRTALMIANVVLFAVVQAGMLPTKVSALLCGRIHHLCLGRLSRLVHANSIS